MIVFILDSSLYGSTDHEYLCTIKSLGSRIVLGTWLALNKYLLSE